METDMAPDRPDQDDGPQGQLLPIKGSETAPFLYVEDFLDASWSGGVAKFRLVRLRRSDDTPNDGSCIEVVAVLAMSVANLIDAHRFIGETIERVKQSADYPPAPARSVP